MSPIRVALIGLSANATTSWASAAHLPYLLSPRGRARFRIVGLLNSTADNARAAIDAFGLGGGDGNENEPRAYASPDELAAAAAAREVDLVVCVTRVDRHLLTAGPAVAAGADVFVEWPLAGDEAGVAELVRVAREKGGRTVVGVQGRLAPVVRKLAEVVASGRVGRVQSVEVRAAGGTNDRDVLPVGLEYFTRLEVGGNPFTIGFGHLFDFVQSAVGDVTDIQSRLQLQRPDVKIRDPETGTIIRTVKSDVPDLIIVTGTLAASQTVQPGATLSITFRRGQPYPGDPPLVWTVHGERGEIRLVAPGGTSLHANAYSEPVTVDVHDFATGKVERVPWEWAPWQEELPVVARSVAALYEAYADGDATKYPTFEDALVRHEQLQSIISAWSA